MPKRIRRDPDIAALQVKAARLAGRAKSTRASARRAEGGAYYREMDEADRMDSEAVRLFAQVAELQKRRKGELAMIHKAKKDLCMAEEAYRALVRRASGEKTDSAGDCRALERRTIIEEMKAKGFAPRRRGGEAGSMARKVRALWGELSRSGALTDGSDAALGKWIGRQTGGRKRRPEWLTPPEAVACIEALKSWVGRGVNCEDERR